MDQVEPTSGTMTSWARLSLFLRYLENIGILAYLMRLYGGVRETLPKIRLAGLLSLLIQMTNVLIG